MAVELEIRDGDPWWLSPDIWTVPGSDPEGAEGSPISGTPCYLWANVTNNGKSSVEDAVVRFYWADPSVGFDRTTANLIGTSSVSLAAGASTDVLCLTPWIPEFVNEGHECVLAEAYHSTLDPLPAAPDFNVSTDRHVAQRNLSVVMALRSYFSFSFTVFNTSRKPRKFKLRIRQGKLAEIERGARRWGIAMPKVDGRLGPTAFVSERCTNELMLDKASGCQHHDSEFEMQGGSRRAMTLIGKVEGNSALVHVEQLCQNRIVGGLSILIRTAPQRNKA